MHILYRREGTLRWTSNSDAMVYINIAMRYNARWITEVKASRSRLVLGWAITWEDRTL